MNPLSLYAFYGSLRHGMPNHSIFKAHLEHVFTTRLTGFKMFSLGSYPFVISTVNSSDSIVVEVIHITDPQTELNIHNLELNAGYEYRQIHVKNITTGIYVFEKEGKFPPVPDGDWVTFYGKFLL